MEALSIRYKHIEAVSLQDTNTWMPNLACKHLNTVSMIKHKKSYLEYKHKEAMSIVRYKHVEAMSKSDTDTFKACYREIQTRESHVQGTNTTKPCLKYKHLATMPRLPHVK